MSQLMDSDLQIRKVFELGTFILRYEVPVSHVDEPNIFHPTDPKFRDKYIVIL
jgi:hypothetical protein